MSSRPKHLPLAAGRREDLLVNVRVYGNRKLRRWVAARHTTYPTTVGYRGRVSQLPDQYVYFEPEQAYRTIARGAPDADLAWFTRGGSRSASARAARIRGSRGHPVSSRRLPRAICTGTPCQSPGRECLRPHIRLQTS